MGIDISQLEKEEAIRFVKWLIRRKVEPISEELFEDHFCKCDNFIPVRTIEWLYEVFNDEMNDNL